MKTLVIIFIHHKHGSSKKSKIIRVTVRTSVCIDMAVISASCQVSYQHLHWVLLRIMGLSRAVIPANVWHKTKQLASDKRIGPESWLRWAETICLVLITQKIGHNRFFVSRDVSRILHWGPQKLRHRGVRIGRGCPLSNRLGDLGERVVLPSGVRGGDPATNAFLAYLRHTEHCW